MNRILCRSSSDVLARTRTSSYRYCQRADVLGCYKLPTFHPLLKRLQIATRGCTGTGTGISYLLSLISLARERAAREHIKDLPHKS